MKKEGLSQDAKLVIVLVLLFVLYPVGIILMFIWMPWKRWVKWLITLPFILGILAFIFAMVIAFLVVLNAPAQLQKAQDKTIESNQPIETIKQ